MNVIQLCNKILYLEAAEAKEVMEQKKKIYIYIAYIVGKIKTAITSHSVTSSTTLSIPPTYVNIELHN